MTLPLKANISEKNDKVMVLLAARAPPPVGVNANIASTFLLPITLSYLEIENKLKFAAPPIAPEQQ